MKKFAFDLGAVSRAAEGTAAIPKEKRDIAIEETLSKTREFENRWKLNFSDFEMPVEYVFNPRILPFGVGLRASIVRLAFFKLLGIGLLALAVGLRTSTGPHAGFSCCLSAAVNLIAAGHYLKIWDVRAQRRHPSRAALAARTTVGYEPLAKESSDPDVHAKAVRMAQETLVDSLRHTDWVSTLTVMAYDLALMREELSNHGGPAMPLSKETIAGLQGPMVFLGAFYRFFLHEGRVRPEDGDKSQLKGPRSCGTRENRLWIFAFVCFAGASGLFAVSTWGLLAGLDPADYDDEVLKADAMALYMLTLVWVGYPLVQIYARVRLSWVDDNEYPSSLSICKDFLFATLDITSKCGLAVYVATRAYWCNATCEAGVYTKAA